MCHFPTQNGPLAIANFFLIKTITITFIYLLALFIFSLSHFWPYFSQACSFCRMLMNQKNFHFTKIPDKTNDVIFLESPKPCFWATFDHFCPMGIFSKKSGSVTHNYIWAPNTMLSFRQTDGRMDGWTDGQTDRPYFIGPIWPRPGVQKDVQNFL